MEAYQAKNVLQVLNSKIDFIQPVRTKLTTMSKSDKIAPGVPDRQKTRRQANDSDNDRDTNIPKDSDKNNKTYSNKHPNRRIVKARRRMSDKPNNVFRSKSASTPSKLATKTDRKTKNISPIKKVRFSNSILDLS